MQRQAQIIGAGLMGGSLGRALRDQGWFVAGSDQVGSRVVRGVELGCFDRETILGDRFDVSFVCTPVSSVAKLAREALAVSSVVTDIASVKGPVVDAVADPHFVGGHPMAGSEQEGIDGANAAMFQGRTWVLTPTDATDSAAFATVHAVVRSIGAEVISLEPKRHDALVAIVSHVPHLMAAALMGLAATEADEDAALLRLAGGGFRDMTRVAAGHPSIWLDICAENRSAIIGVIDRFSAQLGDLRTIVERGDREALMRTLGRSQRARVSLPTGAPPVDDLVEVRVPVPDRPGFIAEVSTLASDLGVNIYDIEISHSMEGDRGGVLVLVVAAASADLFRGGLLARKFRPAVAPLTP